MTTPFKKIVKAKLKAKKELTPMEIERERIKYEIATELGLDDKVKKYGWSGLTAEETGRIGGIMTKLNKDSGRLGTKNNLHYIIYDFKTVSFPDISYSPQDAGIIKLLPAFISWTESPAFTKPFPSTQSYITNVVPSVDDL